MILLLTEASAYSEEALSALLPLLPPLRRAAAERARDREARTSRILGYALIVLAARKLLPSPRLGELILSERGKPRLPDPRLSFSLSHTAHGAALAMERTEGELGLDLEAVRPLRSALLSHFASESEITEIARSPDRDGKAIALWTRKEAEAKRSGYGIGQDLRALDTSGAVTAELYVGGVRHMLSLSPAVAMPEILRICPEELLSLL